MRAAVAERFGEQERGQGGRAAAEDYQGGPLPGAEHPPRPPQAAEHLRRLLAKIVAARGHPRRDLPFPRRVGHFSPSRHARQVPRATGGTPAGLAAMNG